MLYLRGYALSKTQKNMQEMKKSSNNCTKGEKMAHLIADFMFKYKFIITIIRYVVVYPPRCGRWLLRSHLVINSFCQFR